MAGNAQQDSTAGHPPHLPRLVPQMVPEILHAPAPEVPQRIPRVRTFQPPSAEGSAGGAGTSRHTCRRCWGGSFL